MQRTMPYTRTGTPLRFVPAGEGCVGAPNSRQLVLLPFNYLYYILVLKIGEDGMKNGK